MTEVHKTQLPGILQQFIQFSLMFVVLTIPFAGKLNSISLLVFGLAWLLNIPYARFRNLLKADFASFFLVYFLYVAGLLYTEDMNEGWFQIEQKLSLLVIPLMMATIPSPGGKNFDSLLYVFVGTCFAVSLYCLGAGILTNHSENAWQIDLRHLTNQELAGYIGNHSTYFSMYIAFSVFIVSEFARKKDIKGFRLIFPGLLMGFFILFLLLLASRIVLLSFVVILSVYAVYISAKQIRLYIFVGLLVLLSGLGVMTSRSEYLSHRFSQVFNVDTENLIGSDAENGVTQRIFFWKSAFVIIGRSPVYGHGTGDAKSEFKAQYEGLIAVNPDFPESVKTALHSFADNNYNAHNQFIQAMVLFGVVGLAAYLYLFLRSFMVSVMRKDTLHFIFLCIVFLTCLTECAMDRQFGLVFIVFFAALFHFHRTEHKSDLKTER